MIITTNGNSDVKPWGGGKGTVGVRGTFASATPKLQWTDQEGPSVPDANWFDVPAPSGAGSGSLSHLAATNALTFASQGICNIELGKGQLRWVTTNATGSTNLEAIANGSIGSPPGSNPG